MNDDNLVGENDKPTDIITSAVNALRDFFSNVALSQSDQDELWLKRGLPARECERAGLKTNDRPNREILEGLEDRFNQEVLVESGLWVRGSGGVAKPNSQFCGYGLVSRKGGPDDSGVWGWKHEGKCNPILIPYRNTQGQLFHIRPHKGGVAGKPPHLYVARSERVCDAPCAMAVITEGEFKAWALHAVLNSVEPRQFGVAALPGITMAKNMVCRQELLSWLKAINPAQVVVVYDSEDKGNPRLPAFKANPRKRHEAQIWARYLAKLLNHEGYDAAVGILPKAWRDDQTGKTDFDSRLATRIRELSRT